MVDVITNSSSELFVCDTEKSVHQIKEMLQDLLNLYNKQTDNEYGFDSVFDEPYLVGSIEDVDNNLKDWGYDSTHYKDFDKGIIVIESSDDNSVPFVMQQWIEEIFNAERFHLG